MAFGYDEEDDDEWVEFIFGALFLLFLVDDDDGNALVDKCPM